MNKQEFALIGKPDVIPNKDYEDAKYELALIDANGEQILTPAIPYRFNEPMPPGLLGSTDGSLLKWIEQYSIPPFVYRA